jgi:hypothetical protein
MAPTTGSATPAVSSSADSDTGGADLAAHPAPAGSQTPQGKPRDSRRSLTPARVKRTAAASRIRQAADAAATLDGRERLRRLADLVRRGAGDAQRAEFIEASISECLDEAVAGPAADRWLSCEAATWALAWMARARRAGSSAGGLLERLVGEARAAQPLLVDGDTLPAQFVLALARLFRDIETCGRMEPAARAVVAGEIARLASPHGVLNLGSGSSMVDRVARWTAFRELAAATGEPAWDEATENHWQDAAATAARLLGRQGRRIVSGGLMPSRSTGLLLESLAGLGGKRQRTVETLQARREAQPPANRGRKRCLPRDLLDQDAAVAILRSSWNGNALRLLIDFRQAVPHLELAVGDRLLVDGPWEWSVTAGGTLLEAEGPWRVECWESDRRASFLELAAPLPGGRQFERQVVMLPHEGVILLADAVTTPGQLSRTPGGHPESNGHASADHLRYASSLRLATGLEADPAEETREVLLFDTRMRMMALPLALPEWRVGRGGRLEATAAGLTLTQETPGTRLYAPLWLDCDPARFGRPLTWRQLTVADSRINLPPWQATGFRVQAGLEQWLVYRSLDAPRNRTLLGCNVSCDFLLGRVKPRGDIARTLEIQ